MKRCPPLAPMPAHTHVQEPSHPCGGRRRHRDLAAQDCAGPGARPAARRCGHAAGHRQRPLPLLWLGQRVSGPLDRGAAGERARLRPPCTGPWPGGRRRRQGQHTTPRAPRSSRPPTRHHPPPPPPPHTQLYTTLKRFADASVRHLDCWDVTVTAPDPSFFPELPYALQAVPDKVWCGLRQAVASVVGCRRVLECCCQAGRPLPQPGQAGLQHATPPTAPPRPRPPPCRSRARRAACFGTTYLWGWMLRWVNGCPPGKQPSPRMTRAACCAVLRCAPQSVRAWRRPAPPYPRHRSRPTPSLPCLQRPPTASTPCARRTAGPPPTACSTRPGTAGTAAPLAGSAARRYGRQGAALHRGGAGGGTARPACHAAAALLQRGPPPHLNPAHLPTCSPSPTRCRCGCGTRREGSGARWLCPAACGRSCCSTSRRVGGRACGCWVGWGRRARRYRRVPGPRCRRSLTLDLSPAELWRRARHCGAGRQHAAAGRRVQAGAHFR